jgi:hypothetical protein
MDMSIVFKALPSRYVGQLLAGSILFRNLVYFKRIEADPRADLLEGKHVDAPDHDVKITAVASGRGILGRFQFHNGIERMDRVFCFCTSRAREGVRKFGDACVEIAEAEELGRRIRSELVRRRSFDLDEPPLIADEVTYYEIDKAAPPEIDIKNPRHVPFLKRASYSDEKEFRYVWARHGGFSLKQSIVNQNYREAEDMKGMRPANFLVEVGSLRDIARQVDFQ